jgi:hypothetical protein
MGHCDDLLFFVSVIIALYYGDFTKANPSANIHKTPEISLSQRNTIIKYIDEKYVDDKYLIEMVYKIIYYKKFQKYLIRDGLIKKKLVKVISIKTTLFIIKNYSNIHDVLEYMIIHA